ncbi:MAG: hypothetical protein Q8K13_10470 [Parvibaculum sp.]|uniref:hypothetical protein n=1 Tax=Parvibaculum sp. TaxID=2024848 RepID=UPI002731E89C|nr:hypothetical protein [Parvibaculum sp.]MDP2150052.1 hypothetical protein [Parvibaculum sp.]
MQISFNISEIEARRIAVRLTIGDLAAAAGINRSLYERHRDGATEMRLGSCRAVSDAISREEQRLLAHLIALHPETARDLVSGSEGGSHRTDAGGAGESTQAARPAGATAEGEAA